MANVNPNNPAPFGFGADYQEWAKANIEFLKRRYNYLIANGGGGGGGSLAIGEPISGASPMKMLISDGSSLLNEQDIPTADMTVGDPIIGGVNDGILYKDSSGNLASDDSFTYTGRGAGAAFTIYADSASVGIIDEAATEGVAFNYTKGVTSNFTASTPDSGLCVINFAGAGSNTLATPDSSGTLATEEWVDGQKGMPNGIASLDGTGLVPLDQLPIGAVLINKGAWNAATNTPTLADGVGDNGDFYVVSVSGTQNLGSGSIDFVAGNGVLYNGSIYQQIGAVMTATITSVSSTDVTLLTVALGTSTPELTVIAAPKLQTARTINNVSFDGTTNVLLNNSYNNQSGTTYTFVLADNQKVITATNTSAQTYTIPTNASVAFPVGTRIDVISIGTGTVTFSPFDGTVNLNSYLGRRTLAGQYAAATLMKRGTNTWDLIGNLV